MCTNIYVYIYVYIYIYIYVVEGCQRAAAATDELGTPDPDPRNVVSWCF